MHIRKSKERDRSKIMSIARKFAAVINLADKKERLADAIGSTKVIVACDDADKPLGFLYAYLKGSGHHLYKPGHKELFVSALCVNADYHRKGTGKALLGELLKSNGHRTVTCHVDVKNDAGLALLTSAGFEQQGSVFFMNHAAVEKDNDGIRLATYHLRPFEVTADEVVAGLTTPYDEAATNEVAKSPVYRVQTFLPDREMWVGGDEYQLLDKAEAAYQDYIKEYDPNGKYSGVRIVEVTQKWDFEVTKTWRPEQVAEQVPATAAKTASYAVQVRIDSPTGEWEIFDESDNIAQAEQAYEHAAHNLGEDRGWYQARVIEKGIGEPTLLALTDAAKGELRPWAVLASKKTADWQENRVYLKTPDAPLFLVKYTFGDGHVEYHGYDGEPETSSTSWLYYDDPDYAAGLIADILSTVKDSGTRWDVTGVSLERVDELPKYLKEYSGSTMGDPKIYREVHPRDYQNVIPGDIEGYDPETDKYRTGSKKTAQQDFRTFLAKQTPTDKFDIEKWEEYSEDVYETIWVLQKNDAVHKDPDGWYNSDFYTDEDHARMAYDAESVNIANNVKEAGEPGVHDEAVRLVTIEISRKFWEADSYSSWEAEDDTGVTEKADEALDKSFEEAMKDDSGLDPAMRISTKLNKLEKKSMLPMLPLDEYDSDEFEGLEGYGDEENDEDPRTADAARIARKVKALNKRTMFRTEAAKSVFERFHVWASHEDSPSPHDWYGVGDDPAGFVNLEDAKARYEELAEGLAKKTGFPDERYLDDDTKSVKLERELSVNSTDVLAEYGVGRGEAVSFHVPSVDFTNELKSVSSNQKTAAQEGLSYPEAVEIANEIIEKSKANIPEDVTTSPVPPDVSIRDYGLDDHQGRQYVGISAVFSFPYQPGEPLEKRFRDEWVPQIISGYEDKVTDIEVDAMLDDAGTDYTDIIISMNVPHTDTVNSTASKKTTALLVSEVDTADDAPQNFVEMEVEAEERWPNHPLINPEGRGGDRPLSQPQPIDNISGSSRGTKARLANKIKVLSALPPDETVTTETLVQELSKTEETRMRDFLLPLHTDEPIYWVFMAMPRSLNFEDSPLVSEVKNYLEAHPATFNATAKYSPNRYEKTVIWESDAKPYFMDMMASGDITKAKFVLDEGAIEGAHNFEELAGDTLQDEIDYYTAQGYDVDVQVTQEDYDRITSKEPNVVMDIQQWPVVDVDGKSFMKSPDGGLYPLESNGIKARLVAKRAALEEEAVMPPAKIFDAKTGGLPVKSSTEKEAVEIITRLHRGSKKVKAMDESPEFNQIFNLVNKAETQDERDRLWIQLSKSGLDGLKDKWDKLTEEQMQRITKMIQYDDASRIAKKLQAVDNSSVENLKETNRINTAPVKEPGINRIDGTQDFIHEHNIPQNIHDVETMQGEVSDFALLGEDGSQMAPHNAAELEQQGVEKWPNKPLINPDNAGQHNSYSRPTSSDPSDGSRPLSQPQPTPDTSGSSKGSKERLAKKMAALGAMPPARVFDVAGADDDNASDNVLGDVKTAGPSYEHDIVDMPSNEQIEDKPKKNNPERHGSLCQSKPKDNNQQMRLNRGRDRRRDNASIDSGYKLHNHNPKIARKITTAAPVREDINTESLASHVGATPAGSMAFNKDVISDKKEKPAETVAERSIKEPPIARNSTTKAKF